MKQRIVYLSSERERELLSIVDFAGNVNLKLKMWHERIIVRASSIWIVRQWKIESDWVDPQRKRVWVRIMSEWHNWGTISYWWECNYLNESCEHSWLTHSEKSSRTMSKEFNEWWEYVKSLAEGGDKKQDKSRTMSAITDRA